MRPLRVSCDETIRARNGPHTHPGPLLLFLPQNTASPSSACQRLLPSLLMRCRSERRPTHRPSPQAWLLPLSYVALTTSAATHCALVQRVRCVPTRRGVGLCFPRLRSAPASLL